MPLEVKPVRLEDPPDQSTDIGGATRDEALPPTTDQGARSGVVHPSPHVRSRRVGPQLGCDPGRTGVPDAGQTVLIEPIGSCVGGSATAGMASTTNPRDRHPDDDAGQDPIREAEELRRGDPLALRREAEARLDAYEAAVDEPDQTQGFGRILRLHDTAYRALLLLDLRGLEVRFGMEDGEPRLHGTVTAIEDDPEDDLEDGPVLTVTLPRRPRQRKNRTERWTPFDVLEEAHLR